MKKLIYDTLVGAVSLQEVEVGEAGNRVYQRYALGEVGIPDKPDFPFILIGELPAFPARNKPKTSRALTHFIQVYVYDHKGSYVRIEAILELVRELVLALEGEMSASGSRCLGVGWDTTSQDYDDDNYDAFVKHITFSITGSTKQP